MSETKKFRSALNGFNRQDVVQYIEYLNNRNRMQVQQLTDQLKAAKEAPKETVEALESRVAELEAQLAEKEAQLAEVQEAPAPAAIGETPAISSTEEELEAYRRAERAERQAYARAQGVYEKANGVLADVTAQTDAYAKAMDAACAQLVEAMDAYKTAVALNRPKLEEAAETLAAIRVTE